MAILIPMLTGATFTTGQWPDSQSPCPVGNVLDPGTWVTHLPPAAIATRPVGLVLSYSGLNCCKGNSGHVLRKMRSGGGRGGRRRGGKRRKRIREGKEGGRNNSSGKAFTRAKRDIK